MRPAPPANLVERLERWHLATPAQVTGVGARVRKLAGELVDFESVWVDALAQAKVITPWQAGELKAGRGEQLVHGNYVLAGRIGEVGVAECYLAKHCETNETVRLYLCTRPQRPLGETLLELKELVARSAATGELPTLVDCGSDGQRVWAVCRAATGTAASQWLAENGRMPTAAVLQVARAMAEQLAALERHAIVHGDLSTGGLLLDRSGNVWLPAPGLRGIVRPQEGIGFAELSPAAYDYLSPERVLNGSPPNAASDLYACGLLWWHLLAGRTPIAGGNARAKLHAIQAARVIDIRSVAQAIPGVLVEAIERCLAKDVANRPTSFAQLAEMLGPPSDAGRELLASLQRSPAGTWQNLRVASRRKPRRRRSLRPAAVGAVVAAGLILLAAGPVFMGSKRNVPQASDSQLVVAHVVETPTPAPPQVKPDDRIVDPAVQPAAAILPAEDVSAPRVVEDLVLPTGEVLRVEQLELEPGMRVRGRGGRRPIVSVPRDGLVVACEKVTFEGIDFIWQEPAGNREAADVSRTMIDLHAQTVSFRACSFNARTSAMLSAIRTTSNREGLADFGVEIRLTDCVFDGTSSVVEHRASGGIIAKLENSLCVASGPMLQLARCPAEGNEVQLLLDHVTSRGDTAVLEMQNSRGLGKPGPIGITATGCALAGTSRAGLIALVDVGNVESLAGAITWNGQGSLVAPRTPMLTTRATSGQMTPLADDRLAVAGLVRGEIAFAGRADGPPADSRVMQWQAPLRSAEPPGADPDRLYSVRSPRE